MSISFRTGYLVLAAALALAAIAAGVGQTRAEAGPPSLLLPWEDGVQWRTGIAGFHGMREALDFFPPDTPLGTDLICEGEPGWYEAVSQYVVLAAAAGTVTQAGSNEVVIDHGNGWRTGYYHSHDFLVTVGQAVQAGQPLAHPSTYGFCTTGPHAHFWAAGPDGETTRNVSLSGRPAAEIGINEVISSTGNFPPDATPTPTPAPEPTPAPDPLWADANCDGAVSIGDAQKLARHLVDPSVSQQGACPDIGSPVTVDGIARSWGDVDCGGAVNIADAQKVARHLIGLPVAQTEPCPPLDSNVMIS